MARSSIFVMRLVSPFALPAKVLLLYTLAFASRAPAQNSRAVAKPEHPTEGRTTQVSETIQKNKETIRRMYHELLNSRRFDELNGVISEDYIGIRGEKGVAGFKETVQSVVAGFPDIKWSIEDLLADGNKVIVRWSWKGTNTGSFRGIAASNNVVTDNAIAIYQFDDSGKINHSWMQGDRLGVLLQIGAIPANLVPQPPGK